MAFGNTYTRWIYNRCPAPIQDIAATVFSLSRGRAKYGGRFRQLLEELERTQRCDNDQLRALQDHKIAGMARYLENYVPFYAELFARLGLSPAHVRSVEQLRCLPYLEKDTVQGQIGRFLSLQYGNSRDVEVFQTSGTTGKALDVRVTRDCLRTSKALTWLHRSWGGVQIGDRMAAFVGFPMVPVSRRLPPFWVYDHAESRLFFSLQHMSMANLPAFSDEIVRFRPVFIDGYPMAIYLMASYLRDAGITSVRPKAVFTSSETLFQHQRDVIEEVFGCKVLDFYGTAEFVANIPQCQFGNYHVRSEFGVVEVLNPDGADTAGGQVGELVCSGLSNPAMPLVRYRVGDMAVPKDGSCQCGRGGRLIETIVGRAEDVIVTPDGRHLSRLDFVFKGILHVREAQIIQDERDHLRVRIVKGPGFSCEDQARVLCNLRERIGDEMRIDLEFVDHIPRTGNGKFRYVVSMVRPHVPGVRQTGEVLGLAPQDARTM